MLEDTDGEISYELFSLVIHFTVCNIYYVYHISLFPMKKYRVWEIKITESFKLENGILLNEFAEPNCLEFCLIRYLIHKYSKKSEKKSIVWVNRIDRWAKNWCNVDWLIVTLRYLEENNYLGRYAFVRVGIGIFIPAFLFFFQFRIKTVHYFHWIGEDY